MRCRAFAGFVPLRYSHIGSFSQRGRAVDDQPLDQGSEEDVKFTLGKGNQSAICGGVTPMRIIDPAQDSADDSSS